MLELKRRHLNERQEMELRHLQEKQREELLDLQQRFSSSRRTVCADSANSLQSSADSVKQLRTPRFEHDDLLKEDPLVDHEATHRLAPAMEAIRLVKNGTRFSEGHFVVSLPCKKVANTVSRNYESSLVGLKQLKCHLVRDEALRKKYVKSMKLMMDKGLSGEVVSVASWRDQAK
ncbi:unnamed protein product [Echinostoma caproni]|uniref:Myosin motor domain-containing protein n=1 Tax=Echinostoma caproni TaxID=27848 RepID=A0A183BF24_9TREM|nr:unnamed protein product [Echinostoma caproni]